MGKQMDALPPRGKWAVCLAAAERSEVVGCATKLSERYRVTQLKPATSGLAMLQVAESVKQTAFQLGELSVSRAAVRLSDAEGNNASGAAIIMADDEELASSIAILDGVLAASWVGSTDIAALILAGQEERLRVSDYRRRILASTAVDFATLDEET